MRRIILRILLFEEKNKREEKLMEKKFIFENNAFDLMRYWAAITVMLGHFVWKATPHAQDDIVLRSIGKMSTFFQELLSYFQ